ncbi:MAG: hypothetical protein GX601_09145 [Anaerolineales bacterium]|nr:hypothetical protein [Anaerolineales bacterium]
MSKVNADGMTFKTATFGDAVEAFERADAAKAARAEAIRNELRERDDRINRALACIDAWGLPAASGHDWLDAAAGRYCTETVAAILRGDDTPVSRCDSVAAILRGESE